MCVICLWCLFVILLWDCFVGRVVEGICCGHVLWQFDVGMCCGDSQWDLSVGVV